RARIGIRPRRRSRRPLVARWPDVARAAAWVADEPIALRAERGPECGAALRAPRRLWRQSRPPNPSSTMSPTPDLVRRFVFRLFAGLSTEQRVVDGVGVGLEVARKALEHLADGGARVLGRVLEKNVVLVGEDDEEMAFAAGLPLPWNRLGLNAHSG